MELNYRELVKRVVVIAHAQDVFVEGQIGALPDGWEGCGGGGEITDPGLAKSFVDETGIDALSVSIGNVHVLTSGKAPVNMDALRRIRAQVQVPLVVHGGTGFPSECAAGRYSRILAMNKPLLKWKTTGSATIHENECRPTLSENMRVTTGL